MMGLVWLVRAVRQAAARRDERCAFCSGERMCDARYPAKELVCTRYAGHAGDHIAHTRGDEVVARWAPAPPEAP